MELFHCRGKLENYKETQTLFIHKINDIERQHLFPQIFSQQVE